MSTTGRQDPATTAEPPAIAPCPALHGRVLAGLVLLVLVSWLLAFVLLKPLFLHLFPGNPTATTVRRVLQLLILVFSTVYCAVRLTKLYGQRVIFAPLTRVVVGAFVVGLLPMAALYGVLKPLLSSILGSAAVAAGAAEMAMLGGSVLLYSWLFRTYEKRKIHELSRAHFAREAALGFGTGIAIPSLTIMLLFVGGYYTVAAVNHVSVLASGLISLAFVSSYEELLFRGVIYRISEERLGTHVAVVLSAAIFGLAHLSNDNVTLAGLLSATMGGTVLGVLFSVTGRLWLPISFHFGWNFSQMFFGSNISGTGEFGSFLEGRLEGPDALTGGAFGIETSIPLLIGLLALIAGLYYRVIRKGLVVRPYWDS